ncbi:MAG TPA: tRNA (guanosine(37)-N1)-methyltransferase TrmD [Polyangiaceae bacterium LLY-WYZ-14_1]|nr:tRNA (guanosine(37)-N1)-methyltransferase TrmD [Polyangiaceae bacterium LLY-WYZ-14_1]
MHIELVTLFPELFGPHLGTGILARAVRDERVRFGLTDPRDFARDRHKSVDDTPYGGGGGMVLMPGPMVDAIESASERAGKGARRLLLSPQGRPFHQSIAEALAREPGLVLICGRYEGFDERIRHVVDDELSLGDFVLLGGEVAAMAVVEATVRLLPGVLGNEASPLAESHVDGLLEHPHYTRPAVFRGHAVPEVLRSGDHGAVAAWRRRESLRRTLERRPELLDRAALDAGDVAFLESLGWRPAAGERDDDDGGPR